MTMISRIYEKNTHAYCGLHLKVNSFIAKTSYRNEYRVPNVRAVLEILARLRKI